MNKTIYIFIMMLFVIAFGASASNASDNSMAAFSEKFLENLAVCKPYKEVRKIDAFRITIVQEIKGLSNNKCIYENYPYQRRNDGYQCRYTKEQISQIIQAMKKGDQKDNVSIGNLKYESNAIDVLQAKFINDKNVCKFFRN